MRETQAFGDLGRDQISIDEIERIARRIRRWGKWGPDDELGAINFVTEDCVRHAASLVTSGAVFSLAIPFDADGPQTGAAGRINPQHVMLRDGGDVGAGLTLATDDAVYMPLQSATQWDALAHIFEPFERRMWNGHGPEHVTSYGAERNGIQNLAARMVGRGVLLDVARYRGLPWLEAGYAITVGDLEGAAAAAGVRVGRGDFLLVRTGQMAERRAAGGWADYVGGPAPGLSVRTASWLVDAEVAAVAADTFGVEVRPNEVRGLFQPLHRLLVANAGIVLGEGFDLERLSERCAEEGVYEFMFSAAPIPFSNAVGSPVNPIAIK